jgi:hypothetical protein
MFEFYIYPQLPYHADSRSRYQQLHEGYTPEASNLLLFVGNRTGHITYIRKCNALDVVRRVALAFNSISFTVIHN